MGVFRGLREAVAVKSAKEKKAEKEAAEKAAAEIAVWEAIEMIRRGEKEVRLVENRVKDEGAKAIAMELEQNCTLSLLDLNGNSIGAEGCGALTSALQSPHSKLTTLDLGGNRVGDEGCALLASALQSPHSSLTTLYLGYNRIGAKGCAALTSALQSPHSKLTTLYLYGNKIGDKGCAALASALQSAHSSLIALFLGHNKINNKGCALLASALQSPHSSVTSLYLYGNNINNKGCAALASALQSPHSSLTTLDLGGNWIGDEGCAALASALQSPHSSFTTLYLYGNSIGAEGCGALASALQSPCSSLTGLYLGRNRIGDEGCAALASALQSPHSSLITLFLTRIKIGVKGCAALASALQSPHSSLTTLHLGACGIASEGCALLASALQSPHSPLTTIYLGYNRIGPEGCAALASALESPHSKLTTLHLGGNSIGVRGCAALASALESADSKLTVLHLKGSSIGNTGASLLANALEKNTSLRHINMRENVRISTPVKARILGLVQLSRAGVTDVPRHLVAKLPDELLQHVSLEDYSTGVKFGDITFTWSFERIADFAPILSALRELAASLLPLQPSPRESLPPSPRESLPPSPQTSPQSSPQPSLPSPSNSDRSRPPVQRRPTVRSIPTPTLPRRKKPHDPVLLLASDIPDHMLLAWSEVNAILRNGDSLGAGQTSEVFRGELRGEAVAVKVRARSGVKNRLIDNISREVRALCSIRAHPNVLPLKYVVVEKRGIALVLPLAERIDDACVEARKLGGDGHVAREVLLYLYDIASGLRHIHAEGLEHRNLKPANTFLVRNTDAQEEGAGGRRARAVISDFGAAKVLALKTPRALSTSRAQGGTLGTIAYMAPEQAARKSARKYKVTVKSDIWSYGHLVNELVAGRSPYEDEETDPDELVLSKVVAGELLPAADASLPEPLQGLVNECFCFNPLQRPSAHEICTRLEEMLCE